MSRLAGRRLVAASLLAASIVTLAACGSDPDVPSREGQGPAVTAPASETAKAPVDPEADAPPVEEGETLAETPEAIVSAFTAAALGNKDSLNSEDMTSAVQQNSAYLTEEMQLDLIAAASGTDEEAHRHAWYVLPYNVGHYQNDTPVALAVSTPRYSTVIAEGSVHMKVEAITEYTWTYEDSSIPADRFTMTYVFNVIAGDSADGPPFLIAGVDHIERKPTA